MRPKSLNVLSEAEEEEVEKVGVDVNEGDIWHSIVRNKQNDNWAVSNMQSRCLYSSLVQTHRLVDITHHLVDIIKNMLNS